MRYDRRFVWNFEHKCSSNRLLPERAPGSVAVCSITETCTRRSPLVITANLSPVSRLSSAALSATLHMSLSTNAAMPDWVRSTLMAWARCDVFASTSGMHKQALARNRSRNSEQAGSHRASCNSAFKRNHPCSVLRNHSSEE